jgi:hypothetical protein
MQTGGSIQTVVHLLDGNSVELNFTPTTTVEEALKSIAVAIQLTEVHSFAIFEARVSAGKKDALAGMVLQLRTTVVASDMSINL